VALLTGMEVANASMYDGSTGTAEAVLMANRVTRRNKAVLSGGLHPHYREHGRDRGQVRRRLHAPCLDARAPRAARILIALIDATRPASSCRTRTSSAMSATSRSSPEACHAAGALLIVVVTEVVSLGLLSRRARWAPTSSSARASRSATA
jgi:glycine dehydrogenase subunit 1